MIVLLGNIQGSAILSPWAAGPAAVLICVALLLWRKKWMLGVIERRFRGRANWGWAEALIEALAPALSIAIVLGGLALLDRLLPLTAHTDHAFAVVLSGLVILALIGSRDRTLANLFAGIYMIAERPIEPGNFVKLEGGEQGCITKVGWRTTHLRAQGDHAVVVPNAKLAGSVICNFSLPQDELGVSVEVGVDYASDLESRRSYTRSGARSDG